MTTNVFCKLQNVLASDSRWTYENEDTKYDFFGFVDDTNWDKIFHSKKNELGLLFAGNSKLIDSWKSWALSEIEIGNRPAIDLNADFALCIVDLLPGV
jgi:hypothetical protein